MTSVLGSLRSVLSLLAVMVWFLVNVPLLHLVIQPLTWALPARRLGLVSWFMRWMSSGILGLLAAGGARFRRSGQIPSGDAALIVMNHQSLLDIPVVVLMSRPYSPAFVTRHRYRRFIPLVSPCIRMVGCPIVDPKRDARGAIDAVRRTVAASPRTLLIFPEGHRTRDGEVRPFKLGGIQATLETRPMPVYLVVTDGFWVSRRFVDSALNVHRIRGETEVLGPFPPPGDPEQIPAFVESLRDRMVAHLAEMRRRHAAV